MEEKIPEQDRGRNLLGRDLWWGLHHYNLQEPMLFRMDMTKNNNLSEDL